MNSIPHDIAALDTGTPPAWLTSDTGPAESIEEPAFGVDEYAARLVRVRHRMAEQGVAAVLVFRPSSVEYLCGYHTAERLPQPLLVTESDVVLYVPDFEVGRALASCRAQAVRYFRYASAHRALRLVTDHVAQQLPGRARVAVELAHPATPPDVVDLLRQDLTVVDGDYLVERVRLVLSAAELRCVEQAAVHTAAGVDAAVEAARVPGTTDSAIAAASYAAMVAGANSVSAWGPTVATGPRAGIPHSTFDNRALGPHTTFVELSGAHHRYHAPVMRTLSHGTPTPLVRRLAEHSQRMLASVLANAKAGVPCADVARQAASDVGELPDDVVFHQLFGYPVGLAHPPHWMDSAPFAITADNPEPLREGMVFHIPTSFRAFGQTGVGLSHTFVVTSSGTRVLTHGDAELTEV